MSYDLHPPSPDRSQPAPSLGVRVAPPPLAAHRHSLGGLVRRQPVRRALQAAGAPVLGTFSLVVGLTARLLRLGITPGPQRRDGEAPCGDRLSGGRSSP